MSAKRAAEILAERAHGRVERNASLAPFTSYRLGGPAAVLLEAGSTEDLVALSEAARGSGAEVLIVGRGSNMLVSDRGFDGIAVRLGGAFRWTRRHGDRLAGGGATPLPALASFALSEQLTGLEFGVAIPGSLGGAVAMNAGAHGSEMADVLDEVDLFLLGEATNRTIPAADLAMRYRWTALPTGAIVTGASVALRPGEPDKIATAMAEAREWRRAHQPINLPNGGSVFKNPVEEPAGSLVERVCGKGMSSGGARISEVHANFIVAGPGATASDVYTLVRRIQRTVRERTGIKLETEIKMVGPFEEEPDEDPRI